MGVGEGLGGGGEGMTSLLVYLFVTQDYKYSNVKTVKEQTFHKHSTNVPTSNRNETKTSELVPESAPSKEHILFGPGEQILDQMETICSLEDKFGNDTCSDTDSTLTMYRLLSSAVQYQMFWFRFQNDIGMFVLCF